jgi:hypothetical protein
MHYIGFVFFLAFLIIWGIFDYYTEVNDDVPRWTRRALWGPGFLYCITLMQILPILSFNSGPARMMALTYCFLLLFISIPSNYCGHWAIKSYNQQLKRKAIIISSINWVVFIGVSILIFHFINISHKACM